jgi:hypothetical protein
VYKGPLKRRGGTASENGDLQIFLFDHALLMVKSKVVNKHEQLKVFRRVSSEWRCCSLALIVLFPPLYATLRFSSWNSQPPNLQPISQSHSNCSLSPHLKKTLRGPRGRVRVSSGAALMGQIWAQRHRPPPFYGRIRKRAGTSLRFLTWGKRG